MSADITPFIKDAQELEKKTGIPASVTLAQIIQESSGKYEGGLSGLAVQAKNLFGIKGNGTAGTYAASSGEYLNGVYKSVTSNFAKYNSYYESMVDHAAFLSKDRYASKLKDAKSVNDYVHAIKAGGYATDPNYENALLGIINSKDLHQYDGKDFTFKPTAAQAGAEGTGGKQIHPIIHSCRH
jgi:flagellum-specific peptidoglycan hydrolase FlgJ